jgi:hypothetical protein
MVPPAERECVWPSRKRRGEYEVGKNEEKRGIRTCDTFVKVFNGRKKGGIK